MTDFLFARPSFWSGAARVLDFAGTLQTYNTSREAEEADRRALRADWNAVGDDMRWAIRIVETEVNLKTKE